MLVPEDAWLRPDWPAPAGVQALCSTRRGGASCGAFDSFNLGDHVGDDPARVAENRQLYTRALGARAVFMQQIHGWALARLDEGTPEGVTADVALTDRPGLACTVMVADCLPVLLARADGQRVAAAHAGWRGLLGSHGRGVLEVAVQALRDPVPTSARPPAQPAAAEQAAGDLLVWLGPCIGPHAFEVGAEVPRAFVDADAGAAACFVPVGAGKYLADLPALARRRLAALGVLQVYGNDGGQDWCTVHQSSRFFSHRRDRGLSGRFAASIWRSPL